MTVTTAKWSVEDYHRMIETGLLDDRPVELLNGEIIEMTPEREPHALTKVKPGKHLNIQRLLRTRLKTAFDQVLTAAESIELLQ